MKSSTFAALSQDLLGEQTSRPFAGTSRSRPMPRDVTRKPDFLVTYSESGLRAEQTQGPPETSGAHPRPPPSTQGESVRNDEGTHGDHSGTRSPQAGCHHPGRGGVKTTRECLDENYLLRSLASGLLPTQTLPKRRSLTDRDAEQDTERLISVWSEKRRRTSLWGPPGAV